MKFLREKGKVLLALIVFSFLIGAAIVATGVIGLSFISGVMTVYGFANKVAYAIYAALFVSSAGLLTYTLASLLRGADKMLGLD